MRWNHACRRHAEEDAMRFDTSRAQLPLAPGGHARLHHARDARLTGIAGTTWITVDGDLADVFVGPGASFVVPSDDVVVAMAIDGDALLEISGRGGAVRATTCVRGATGPWRLLRRLLGRH
jgi:hypothetical protein